MNTEALLWLQDAVLHRDDALLVLNKPAGLAVHPGPRTPQSLEDYLPALRFGRREPPQPVHRLDRDTSGCLVLGRTRSAVRRLTASFAGREVAKTYWAVVEGAPPAAEGAIDRPLAKHNDRLGWRMVAEHGGLAAVTRYRVRASGTSASLLELMPETGRTHQIRVHCALLGCPVMDDPIYGRGDGSAPHRLHARRVVIPGRDGATAIDVTAPLPQETLAVMARLGLSL